GPGAGECRPAMARSSAGGQRRAGRKEKGLTFQICGLLLAECAARLADARRQRHLEVVGHGLFGAAEGAAEAGLVDDRLDALDGDLALVEAAGDALGEALDLALLVR